MSEPFLGEIVMFGGNFAPAGWSLCDGQLVPINQAQTLFSILETTYGGNGTLTFGLPDLRGRTPVHPGEGLAGPPFTTLGQIGGRETVALGAGEIAAHDHPVNASSDTATTGDPTGNVLAQVSISANVYGDPNNLVAMNPDAVGNTGSGAEHFNMQPFLAVSFIIALSGSNPNAPRG